MFNDKCPALDRWDKVGGRAEEARRWTCNEKNRTNPFCPASPPEITRAAAGIFNANSPLFTRTPIKSKPIKPFHRPPRNTASFERPFSLGKAAARVYTWTDQSDRSLPPRSTQWRSELWGEKSPSFSPAWMGRCRSRLPDGTRLTRPVGRPERTEVLITHVPQTTHRSGLQELC